MCLYQHCFGLLNVTLLLITISVPLSLLFLYCSDCAVLGEEGNNFLDITDFILHTTFIYRVAFPNIFDVMNYFLVKLFSAILVGYCSNLWNFLTGGAGDGGSWVQTMVWKLNLGRILNFKFQRETKVFHLSDWRKRK